MNKNCGPDLVKYIVVQPSTGGSATGSTGNFTVCNGVLFAQTISGCTDSVNLNGNIFYNNGNIDAVNIINAPIFSGGTYYGDGSNLTGIPNNYATGGTYYNGSIIISGTGEDFKSFVIDVSSLIFTGNTSGNCITDLYVTNIHGCSPITMHDSIRSDNSVVLDDSYSSAFGDNVVATGATSHAEGRNTRAIGDYSHSEGWGNLSSGEASHSEGRDTTASGDYSHSQGFNTIADGTGTHSGGYGLSSTRRVVASGDTSFVHFRNNSTTDKGVYSDYGVILGGQNHNVGNGSSSSAIFAGNDNKINNNVLRSVILGGQDITGTTNDTVYVPNLNIVITPSQDNNILQILGRGSDGSIKYRDVNSITGATPLDTYVTGFTFNNATYDLTIKQNNGQPDLTSNLAVLASDIYVLSGVYNPSTGIVTYTNSSGGTFQVSGFTTGMTDSYTTNAYINGTEIRFDNNIQGANLYNVDLLPLLSGKTDTTTFNSYTASTQIILDSKVSTTNNVGGANGLFKDKSGTTLNFRTISGGSNTTISTIGDVIKVDVTIPPDTNTFVTGFTYDNVNTFTIGRNDGVNLTSTISVLSGITYYGDGIGLTNIPINGVTNLQTELDTKISGATNLSSEGIFAQKNGFDLEFKGLTSTGGTVNISSDPNTVNLEVTFPTDQDKFVSGGTYNSSTLNLDFVGNSTETTFSVDLTSLVASVSADTNTFVTGGTYNDLTNTITLSRNDGGTIGITGITDSYVTGATLNGNNLELGRNEGLSTLSVDLSSIDTYVTGFTFNNATYDLTIKQNNGQPDLTSNLAVLASDIYVLSGVYNPSTGIVTYTNSSGGTFQVSGFTTGMTDSYTTAANLNGETIEFDNNIQGPNLYSVSLTPILSGKTESANNVGGANELFKDKSGTTLNFRTLSGGTNTTISTVGDVVKVDVVIPSDANNFVTGNTNTVSANNNTSNYTTELTYNETPAGVPYNLTLVDTFVTGGTLSGNNLILDRNDGTQTTSIDLSALDTVDTYVTGFTWTDSTNTLTISQNEGQSDLSVVVDSFTGPITVNGDFTVTGGTTTVCDILPTKTWNVGGGCDVGAVGSRFLNVYTRFLQLGTSTTILGDDGSNFEMSGNTGNFIFRPAADSTFHSDVVPGIDLGYSIGQPALRWDVYAGNLSVTGLTADSVLGKLEYDQDFSPFTGNEIPSTQWVLDQIGTGSTDVYVTGMTWNSTGNTLTLERNDGTTITENINITNIEGDITISGKTIGDSVFKTWSQWYINNSTTATTTPANVPIKVGLNPPVTWSPNSKGFTFSATSLTFVEPSTQEFHITVSMTAEATANNQLYEFWVERNGVKQNNLVIENQFGTQRQAVSLTGIVEMSPNDIIELWMENNTANKDIIISFINFSIVQI